MTLALLLAATAMPAYAQGAGRAGQIVFGRDVKLESGQTFEGDLIVLGGHVTMAAGSRIAGNLTILAGSAVLNGSVQGNVFVVGGNIYLASTAQVTGNVSAVGGRIQREAGAHVAGATREIGGLNLGQSVWRFAGWGLPVTMMFGWSGSSVVAGVWRLFWVGVTAMVVAIIGLLAVRLLPHHSATIVHSIRNATAASFGVGLLIGSISLFVIAVLMLTVCLSPLGMILTLPLVLATLLGWTMVGYWLGQHLMPLLNKRASPEPMVTALVGTLVLTAGQQILIALGRTPCLGFFFWLIGVVVWLIAAATGLGAIVLSRLGTRQYPTSSPAIIQPVVQSENVPSVTVASTLTTQAEMSTPGEEAMDNSSRRRSPQRRKRTSGEPTKEIPN